MDISASILDIKLSSLASELRSIATTDRVHLDIMDGHFVPHVTFRAASLIGIPFPVECEAHLMVNDPETFFPEFLSLGVSGIIFHIENTGEKKALALLKHLHEKNIRAGICIDGCTDDAQLSNTLLEMADQVLVMSVKAGKGGQSFQTESLGKIQRLRERGFKREIEVDGGVNLDNAADIKKAGADRVVVGSFLMRKALEERAKIIEAFHKI